MNKVLVRAFDLRKPQFLMTNRSSTAIKIKRVLDKKSEKSLSSPDIRSG